MEPRNATTACDDPSGRPQEMTLARRRELIRFAQAVADMIEERVQPHERCFFREAVQLHLGPQF